MAGGKEQWLLIGCQASVWAGQDWLHMDQWINMLVQTVVKITQESNACSHSHLQFYLTVLLGSDFSTN